MFDQKLEKLIKKLNVDRTPTLIYNSHIGVTPTQNKEKRLYL